MNTPSKCRACGSSDLIWFILRNTGGAQGEPLRMPEIAYDFILGCKECSETLRVLRADDVAEYLTLLRTLPAQERAQSAAVSGAQAAQSASDDVFEEGQWWLEELDSIVANGTPTQRRAMAVVRNLLSCWQRAVQGEQQPVGEMISNDGDIYWADRHPPMGTKLYAAPVQPAEQQEQQPVAWGAFRFGGSRSGKLYSYCETEQQIDSYITDVHRSNDSITLRKAPLYTAPIAQTAQSEVQSLREALEAAEKNERHRNNSETRYWCDQYKQLARAILARQHRAGG